MKKVDCKVLSDKTCEGKNCSKKIKVNVVYKNNLCYVCHCRSIGRNAKARKLNRHIKNRRLDPKR